MSIAETCQEQLLPTFVSLNNPSEIELWCLMFDCSEQELRHAIACAGKSSAAIEVFLLYRRLMRKI